MKTIIRNFLSVLRRFKMAAILNLLGLSVAFAAFMFIMMQVGYEMNYNASHSNRDRIMRLEIAQDGKTFQAVINRPMAESIAKNSPHVLKFGLSNPWDGKRRYTVKNDKGESEFYFHAVRVSVEFPEVFDFEILDGTAQSILDPGKILIPESLAKAHFSMTSPVGEQLFFEGGNYTVGGVYRDFPKNDALTNSIYYKIPDDENTHNWGNWNYHIYYLLDDPSSAGIMLDHFTDYLDHESMGFSSREAMLEALSRGAARFTPLSDLYYTNDVTYDTGEHGSKGTTWLLIAIAFVIILIAGINFTNFSTALTPMRIKSINTQKVLGSSNRSLRAALIAEAVGMSLLSFAVALMIVFLSKGTFLERFISSGISIRENINLVLFTGGLSVFSGILAGLYPAFYITSFNPAIVLKGSFGLSPKGKRMRSVLLGFQFIASIALVIGASFIYLQNRYMMRSQFGYDKDRLIVTTCSSKILNARETFVNELKSFGGIEEVGFSDVELSIFDDYMGWGREFNGTDISFKCLPVRPGFLKTIGIEVLEGRDFTEADPLKERGAFIFNQTAKEMYGLELGATLGQEGEIIGFMPDIKFSTLRNLVEPMCFYVWGTNNWGFTQPNAYIRIAAGTDVEKAIRHVHEAQEKFDSYKQDVRYFDEYIQAAYVKERNLSSLITLFSIIAILISVVGVFGLVVFESGHKRKEIGVRRVFGASIRDILVLFNRTYIKLLIICCILAMPLSYYLISRWLAGFAYKTPMFWWVFVCAFLCVSLITLLTVTFQNWRAANENPVNCLRNE